MKNKDNTSLVFAGIGIIGLIAGIAAGKIQEKRYQKERERLEKESKDLHNYALALGVATEQYCGEVDEISALADGVLKYIEESEKDLDEEEEL